MPNPIHPTFIQDLSDVKNKVVSGTQKELIFEEIIHVAGLDGKSYSDQYAHINDILDARAIVHNAIIASGLDEDVSTIGGVTELICELALKATVPNKYSTLPDGWKWVGDFAIMGSPFNVFISVKSYYARERLIVSGMGQNAAPVVGWGLFEKLNEWSPSRVKQYKQRGFLAIYMPEMLYNELLEQDENNPALTPREKKKYPSAKGYPVTKIVNIYDRPLIRKINDFADDIARVYSRPDFRIDLEKF